MQLVISAVSNETRLLKIRMSSFIHAPKFNVPEFDAISKQLLTLGIISISLPDKCFTDLLEVSEYWEANVPNAKYGHNYAGEAF